MWVSRAIWGRADIVGRSLCVWARHGIWCRREAESAIYPYCWATMDVLECGADLHRVDPGAQRPQQAPSARSKLRGNSPVCSVPEVLGAARRCSGRGV
jgi:hypothetical protein